MRPGASPLWEQILTVGFGPPIMAWLFKFRASGWAHTVQGETLSETTKKRQKLEFWVVLGLLYAIGIGVFIYASVTS
jgi:hypothetical protein